MKTYTDTQLKQTLAKMLPEQLTTLPYQGLYWDNETEYREVLDTELLHLCWLVEDTLRTTLSAGGHPELDSIDIEWNIYIEALFAQQDGSAWSLTHATWQQRTIALAKVKGIEIV